jgi:acyl carrier protein
VASGPSRQEVLERVLEAVKAILRGIDFELSGGIRSDSRLLADLDLESVQVVQLFTKIQKSFGNRRIPFQDLIFRGDEVVDFTLRDLADFVHSHVRARVFLP